MRTAWRYAQNICKSLGLLMSISRLGVIRFVGMDTWGGSKGKNPIQRLRHLLTTGIRTWPLSMSSTGLINISKPVVTHSLPICGSQCYANWILGVFLRYFMKELFPLGA
jgi:hypothetical protein